MFINAIENIILCKTYNFMQDRWNGYKFATVPFYTLYNVIQNSYRIEWWMNEWILINMINLADCVILPHSAKSGILTSLGKMPYLWIAASKLVEINGIQKKRLHLWHYVSCCDLIHFSYWVSQINKTLRIVQYNNVNFGAIYNFHLLVCQVSYRCWAGKTSYVHLAPEHEFTIKQKRRPE